jgi:two-component system invasion response regulator UvrY
METRPQFRLLIADDHAIVRAGLIELISAQGDLQVAAEAASGDEVLAHLRREKFDVVVLDISMPNKNGIDTLRVIRQTQPDLPVLVLSGYPEEHYAVNLVRVHPAK